MYDGFISYSHAADDLLAPRLQAALQRFAKPWWKRRAVRIFRDESSLSANPHLWSSITEALDTSGWFVLLLSPDAAQSEWVNQEISYWVENRDPKKILPVVTDGEFGWAGGRVAGDAVPDSLRGVFTEEPRWVDLRFARDEEQLDLKHPEFNSAIADIASTIRGVPKDELASEEVRQHRRTVRTAWIAGVALVALTVVAVGAAVFAFGQQNEANRQRDLAQESEARARESEQRALDNEQRALENEQRALDQAAIVEARRLATIATLVEDPNPELSTLLLLHAITIGPPESVQGELKLALRDAMLRNPILNRIDVPLGRNSVAISPDGDTVYYASPAEGTVRAVSALTGVDQWLIAVPGFQLDADNFLRPPPLQLMLQPDGRSLAVLVNGDGSQPARIVVADAANGDIEHEVRPGQCGSAWLHGDGYSPDGELFSVSTGTAACDDEDLPDADWAVWFDTETWEEVGRYQVEGAINERVAFSLDGERMLASFVLDGQGAVAEVLDPLSDSIEATLFGALPAFTTFGDAVIYEEDDDDSLGGYWGRSTRGLTRFVLETSNSVSFALPEPTSGLDYDHAFGHITRYRLSPAGSRTAAIFEREVFIWSEIGEIDHRLSTGQDAYDLAWSADGSRLVTAHEDRLILWAIDPDRDRTALINRTDDWAALAVELLDRSFTETECLQWRIDPCPSLEDLRAAFG